MTTLSSATLDLMAPGAVKTPETPHALPLSVRLIQYLTDAGALAATATLIYGIAMNLFPFIALGAIFLAMTACSFYLIHQIANLKTIEEDTTALAKINASMAAKEAKILQLTAEIDDIGKKFTLLQQDYTRLMQQDDAVQKKFNAELQHATDDLEKTQAEAKTAMESLSKTLTDQILALQKQTERDQKTISDLNQTIGKANQQIVNLQAALSELQKQIAAYQFQNSEYSRLNTQLQQQIKTLTESARSPTIDVSAINAHAEQLERLIQEQNRQSEKVSKTTAKVSSMLDALDRKLPPKKP
jgi:chromosome segregation ATPase